MNVASLENSKKLYELSGWKTAEHISKKGVYYPAYDLGYLLRKLPICTIIKKDSRSKYLAFAREKYVDVGMQTAKTPEDAACLLAIKLFEEKILQGENS